jgi:hypothetical protein
MGYFDPGGGTCQLKSRLVSGSSDIVHVVVGLSGQYNRTLPLFLLKILPSVAFFTFT